MGTERLQGRFFDSLLTPLRYHISSHLADIVTDSLLLPNSPYLYLDNLIGGQFFQHAPVDRRPPE